MRTRLWATVAVLGAGLGVCPGCGDKAAGTGAAPSGATAAKMDQWKCACGKIKEVATGAAQPVC